MAGDARSSASSTRGARAARSEDRTPARAGGGSGGGSSVYPESVDRLVDEFATLPGVGRRTAERLAFHVLKSTKEEALRLAAAISDVKKSVRHCSTCYNLTEADPCAICSDPHRRRDIVLVVEQPKDLIALEQTGMHKGVYHVLMGRISPLDDVGPEDLTVAPFLARIDDPSQNSGGHRVTEVILGLNPTVEGDGTALYLADQLRSRGVAVSRLARGLPSGGHLEYVSKAVLADAIQGRQSMQ